MFGIGCGLVIVFGVVSILVVDAINSRKEKETLEGTIADLSKGVEVALVLLPEDGQKQVRNAMHRKENEK